MKDESERFSYLISLRVREREQRALLADAELRGVSPADVLRNFMQVAYGLPQDKILSREQAMSVWGEDAE